MTKVIKKEIKTKSESVVSNKSSVMTRLEIVEKMLLVTRDEFKDIKRLVERMKTRMGL
tara:strand:+ start:602 stop:775 length:174 start_codon:yes stop_codon:yes gene_type:complete